MSYKFYSKKKFRYYFNIFKVIKETHKIIYYANNIFKNKI